MSNRRRRRRRGPALALAIVFIVLAGLTLTGMGFWQADQLQSQLVDHLRSGQAELDAAKTSLKQANANHDATKIAAAKTHFNQAKTHFVAASRLADGSTLLRSAEAMPSIGALAQSRHVAVDGIADMGGAISDAGLALADLDGRLLTPTTNGQQPRNLLNLLNEAGPALDRARADFGRAQMAASRVDVGVVPGSQQAAFIKARAEISTAVVDLDEFRQLMPILREILGGNGPRTYLVEQVNPAELRAGGGFIGSYSALRADQGVLKLVSSGNAYQLAADRVARGQVGYVTPPGPIREFVPTVGWSFVDSNFFPDFASNATAAESFVKNKLGSPVDAVFSIDYYAVAKMLDVTGPLKVPGYDVIVDSHNFVPLLIQYDLDQGYTHKAILGAIAGPLFERISTLSPSQWPALLTALEQLGASRDLQAYFNHPDVESQMNLYGWSGSVNPTKASDFMMEVESNLGGTKANYFVQRHYTVTLTRSGNTLHHKVTVDLTNTMPATAGQAVYYHAYVRLLVPSDATATTDNLVADKYPPPAAPAGVRIIDGWVPLIQGHGGHGTAIFQYDTPWQPGSEGQASVYWQKQPGTLSDKVEVTWNPGRGATYTASGNLGQDLVISLVDTGVSITQGRPGQASLPRISLG